MNQPDQFEGGPKRGEILQNNFEEVHPQETHEKKISSESIRRAEIAIFQTFGKSHDPNLENFDTEMIEAVKQLPKYKQIEKKLEGTTKEDLPHQLFRELKKDSDQENVTPNAPSDGVLISSMMHGHIECAGRSLIASVYLEEHGVDHVVVSAPGHSFVIIEQSSDTLAYFDANNNLYFTFPKTALAGYGGKEKSSECTLKEYIPRDFDVFDGIQSPYSHFVTRELKEGRGGQYLGNVANALQGGDEFKNSNLNKDEEASEAINQLKTKIYGENAVYDNFEERYEIKDASGNIVGGLLIEEEEKLNEIIQSYSEIVRNFPEKASFIENFVSILDGPIGNKFQYIQNAPMEEKRKFAETAWEYLENKKVEDSIKGR